jgi:hypothetical protein
MRKGEKIYYEMFNIGSRLCHKIISFDREFPKAVVDGGKCDDT